MNLIRDVKIFCKGQRTLGRKVSDLYKEFMNKHLIYYKDNKDIRCKAPEISIEKFEDSLLHIKARVAVDLKNRCEEFIKSNGIDSYKKFIREHEFVSQSLWNKAVTEMVNKYPQPQNQESDPPPKPQPKPGMVLTEGFMPQPKQASESVTPSEDRYHQLLPTNWTVMSFSDKVSFVSRVQHKGFFDYILDSDKKLKEYFSKMKHVTPNGLRLYVTIFSIPADSYSEESKNLLRTFVETLNMVGRAKLQYIKCSDPNMIEIREVR